MAKKSSPAAPTCTPYRDLLKIAAGLRKQGFLVRFKTDLIKHDKRALKGYCGPYLWAITGHSTHLSTPETTCIKGTGGHVAAWQTISRGEMGPPTKIFYSPDGKRVKQVRGAVPVQVIRRWRKSCPWVR